MNKGTLIIAGGAIKQSNDIILGEFISIVGYGKICVIATASTDPEDSFDYIKQQLLSLGVELSRIVLLPISGVMEKEGWASHASADHLKYLEGVKGVWFTGGDQLEIVKSFVEEGSSDSPCLEKIREIYKNGGVIGGTSAGAAIMSDPMIARGGDKGALLFPIETDIESYDDTHVEGDEVEPMLIVKGLGFMEDVIVDQHFDKRPRLQRLIKSLQFSNLNLGYGISEDTALIVTQDSRRVIGSSYVTEVRITSSCEVAIRYIMGD